MPSPSLPSTDLHPHDAQRCCGDAPANTSRRSVLAAASVVAGLLGAGALHPTTARAADFHSPEPGAPEPGRLEPAAAVRTADLSWYELVPGFTATRDDPDNSPPGTGFVEPNPWGHYTAYRVWTSDLGHRTWRVENMMQSNALRSQGSTMWLFEGSERALLVDTAQDTPDVLGESDLKLVVHHLLAHEDDGSPRADPVDFDVAITHKHGDHTGKVHQMGDRTVYYPELDWPVEAPSNHVAVREGGGSSAVGDGRAVGRFDLGGRTVHAVAMYGHTPGSTGYLDVENRMLATGDAVGSAYVWAHFASATTSTYREMLDRLRGDVTGPLAGIALLPAHFYQIRQFDRGRPPLEGRPLDARYVEDMFAAASGALDGSIAAEPYRTVGREVLWIGSGSARMTFSLTNLYPGGPSGGDTTDGADAYHLVAIPGTYRSSPDADASYAFLDNIRTNLRMVRDSANNSTYLLQGSERALLIGTGRGTTGFADYVRSLVGDVPLEVLLTDDDPSQTGGLPQFAQHGVHVPAGAAIDTSAAGFVQELHDHDVLSLGVDSAGRTIDLEVFALPGRTATSLTVLDATSRVLFAGDALGEQGLGGGLELSTSLEEFAAALATWRRFTNGRYDTLYTSHNHQWHTGPEYVDSLQAAVADGLARGSEAFVSTPRVGFSALQAGTGDDLAVVLVPVGD